MPRFNPTVSTAAPRAPSSAREYPYSKVQRAFIEDIRGKVESQGRDFFYNHDWREIKPKSGVYCSLQKKVYPESFYVKPLAVWVPHLLFEDFVPTCPHCKSKRNVNVTQARFQNSPKVLFGIEGHRYLDTVLYPCNLCKRRFTGYHPGTIKLDMDRYQGFFNFFFSGRFAIDEDLYSFIVGCYELKPQRIYNVLESLAVDRYLNNYNLYLHAVSEKKIKLARPNVTDDDRRQRTLHATHEDNPVQQSDREKKLRKLKIQLNSKKMVLANLQLKSNNDICFKGLTKVKSSRREHTEKNQEMLPALGIGKLKKLMGTGIMNARQLMDCDFMPHEWCKNEHLRNRFKQLKEMAKKIFDDRNRKLGEQNARIEILEDEIKQEEEAVRKEQDEQEEAEEGNDQPEPRVSLFSTMDDKKGYNAKILSVGRIDQMLMTDFDNRKNLQQSKMLSLPAEILKLDFSYKLPPKLDVYLGVGKCFKPYKCMFVCQNENNQTNYWKACVGNESMDEITHGL